MKKVEQHICNKCGAIIEGTETIPRNIKKGRLKKEEITICPWIVTIETEHWTGHRFELCNLCEQELLLSLKYPAKKYDC